MRTIRTIVRIYKFSELSDKAKEAAKQEYREAFGYAWSSESLNSLEALAKHFDGKMVDYQIDWFGNDLSRADFEMAEMPPDDIAAKLAELGTFDPETLEGYGDCKLTGYCHDESAIDGFRKAFQGPRRGVTNLHTLMYAAFKSWLAACQEDCKDQFSDEQFDETCEANNWEFRADGTLQLGS